MNQNILIQTSAYRVAYHVAYTVAYRVNTTWHHVDKFIQRTHVVRS